MKQSTTIILCALSGMLGASIQSNGWLTGVPSATADTLTGTKVEELDSKLVSRTSVLHRGSDLLARIVETASPSVVHILSERNVPRQGRVEETGSGVIMRSDVVSGMFVVTNKHVIADADLDDIEIQLSDGRILNPTRTLLDEKSDIAVMEIKADDIQTGRWGNSDDVNIGHMVMAVGSPFGLSQSVTLGIISAKGRRSLKLGNSNEVINQDFMQTDAAINPGNSGGPLIDLQGRVVGINTAIASSSGGNEGIGFSIPSNLVKFVFDQLVTRGRVQRSYLGVKLDPEFTFEFAQKLKLDRVRGARIVEVYANTPAARAKLQSDDVILKFNNIDVQDENHLINLVSLTPVERKVRMVVLRNGREIAVNVNVADRAELEKRSQASRNK